MNRRYQVAEGGDGMMVLVWKQNSVTQMTKLTHPEESHDQADAEWIVIRTQLRGHNDTPFGRILYVLVTNK
jgi:hypothetical protein